VYIWRASAGWRVATKWAKQRIGYSAVCYFGAITLKLAGRLENEGNEEFSSVEVIEKSQQSSSWRHLWQAEANEGEISGSTVC
jgi:hypothetical protein